MLLLMMWYVKPDKADAIEDILKELNVLELSRAEEGCLFFNVLQDEDDPTIVCFTEGWRSEEAADNHLRSEHIKKLLDRTEGFVGQVETQRRTNWDNPDDENEDKEEKEREETSIA